MVCHTGTWGPCPHLCTREPDTHFHPPDRSNFEKVLFTWSWTLPAHLRPTYWASRTHLSSAILESLQRFGVGQPLYRWTTPLNGRFSQG